MSLDIVVKNSPIEGKGVFAVQDFRKGEVVVSWDISQILTEQGVRQLPANQKRYVSYIGNGRYVLLQEPEKFVNHSCDPNTVANNSCDVAIRDIKKGEEITADYSLEGVRDLEMQCNCATSMCRGILYGDFNRLDTETQRRLEPFRQDWHRNEFPSQEVS